MLESSNTIKRGVLWLERILTEKLFEDHHESTEFAAFLEAFYALYKYHGDSYPLISEFKNVVKEDNFWNSTSFWDIPYLLYFASKMSFSSHYRFLTLVGGLIKQNQNIEGYIKINEYDHTGAMRILILLEPDSRITEKAIDFFRLNIDVFIERSDNSAGFYFDTLPIGLIALHESNPVKYRSTINTLSKAIRNRMSNEGFIKFADLPHRSFKEDVIKNTALTVLAFSKVLGFNDDYTQRGIKWLKSIQSSNGSWNDSILDTSKVIRALITDNS
jgi:hypothetical protein